MIGKPYEQKSDVELAKERMGITFADDETDKNFEERLRDDALFNSLVHLLGSTSRHLKRKEDKLREERRKQQCCCCCGCRRIC